MEEKSAYMDGKTRENGVVMNAEEDRKKQMIDVEMARNG
jgi:hypothetical protein